MGKPWAALLVLSLLLAGCTTPEPSEPSETILEAVHLPDGLVLTYEIDADGRTSSETFLVDARGGQGYDLRPWVLDREDFASPFLRLGPELVPRPFNWSGLFAFPMEAGDTYEAKRVGSLSATVEVSQPSQAPRLPSAGALALNATDSNGTVVLTAVLLDRPEAAPGARGVIAELDINTADGTDERWVLEEITRQADWNAAPTWRLGDHWSYEARTSTQASDPQLVYSGNRTGAGGSTIALLEPTELEDRLAATLLREIRVQDMAPQSGFLTNLLSKLWEWPLEPGASWQGLTTKGNRQVTYDARVQLVEDHALPDGTTTVAFHVEADPRGEPGELASWTYVPRVQMLTEINVTDLSTGETVVDWHLRDWGHEYHGTIERLANEGLLQVPVTPGPTKLEEPFNVTDQHERLLVDGSLVRPHDAPRNATIQLRGPDGTIGYDRGTFDEDQRFMDLGGSTPATPGTWTLSAELMDGHSVTLTVRGIWTEVDEVDFRR